MRRFVLVLVSVCLLAQLQAQVTLQLADKQAEPVVGAYVSLQPTDGQVQGRSIAGVSDLDGRVSLQPSARGEYQLSIRYLGLLGVTRTLDYQGKPIELGKLVMLDDAFTLDAAQVVAVRARSNDPFAFTNVDADALAEANVGQDIPMLLRRTPGAVVTSDAGNGVGYTGVRIRGADATRINVTINGVPLNDSESQAVFWVNMPDFISSTQSIQVQRGVGESTYGTGAFGANINLLTDVPSTKPSVVAELAAGNYRTGRAMLKASTGRMGKFAAEARASYITSDGFVDRASSELGSIYLGTSYAHSDASRSQLIAWTGKERTYQSWFGIPRSFAKDEALRTYNPAGEISTGVYYDDQTDNYRQTHLQLLHSQQLSPDFLLQLTGHYTRGLGFYNEYRTELDPVEYMLTPAFSETDEVDLIRRLWLDNHFFGGIATVSGRLSPKLDLTASAGVNQYRGDHYGTVEDIITPIPPTSSFVPVLPLRWYDNAATKTAVNGFAKANYQASKQLNLYADLQLRALDYQLTGPDRNGRTLDVDYSVAFFNPKLGLDYELQPNVRAFASAAVGQREPNRNDFQAAPEGVTPQAEQLYDFELGLRKQQGGDAWLLEANAYLMLYENQLVPTGRLNDVGEYERVNVDDSYRLGLELAGAYKLNPVLRVEGNLALSRARIARFEEYLDNFGTDEQDVIVREDTPLGFSPAVISNLGLIYRKETAARTLDVALWGNTVSKQFLDNSGSDVASLDGYARVDLEAKYAFAPAGRRVVLSMQVLNLLGAHPITNGYTYRYKSPGRDPRPNDPYSLREEGDTYVYTGVYPQAGIQVLGGVRIELGK